MANCRQCGRKLPTFSFGDGDCKWCKQHAAAQQGKLPEDAKQEVMPTPWARPERSSIIVTQAIAGICAAVFIGMAASGASLMDPTSQDLIRWGANFSPLTMGGEWWRLLTSVFVHIGVVHIALNMWCLWSLGEMAESLYGRWTFATVYLVCGLAGSLTSALTHPGGVSAGASGAIFGIAGALIASFKLGEFSMPRAAVQASLKSVLTFAGYNLLFGFVSGRVDNAAHVGGLLMGLLLGALLAKAAPERNEAGPRVLVLGAVVLVLAGGIGWYQYSHRYAMHLRRGTELIEDKKIDEGIAEIETALRLKPDYIAARQMLGSAYMGKGDYVRAEAEFRKALESDTADAYTLYVLGTLYQAERKNEKAKEMYMRVAVISPEWGEPHFGLGSLAADAGQDEAAVAEYRKAIEVDPELEGVHYNLGLSLVKLKRLDEAIVAFKEEESISGESFDNSNALSDVYAAKGMKKEAEAEKSKAEKMKKD